MPTLEAMRADAARCTRCPLHEHATQTVFGEGATGARLVVVGEQPGDGEDREGRPFVASGLPREQLYVTNAVKHFKWTPRGPRRIHATPSRTEVVACRPWLEAEIEAVGPELVVALGATAGRALLGPTFRVTTQRGRPLDATVGGWSGPVVGTVHPSAVLRVREAEEREREFAAYR